MAPLRVYLPVVIILHARHRREHGETRISCVDYLVRTFQVTYTQQILINSPPADELKDVPWISNFS